MKSLVKNSIYNILYKCINVLYPLIISAYVSRVIFAAGIGKVASAQNIVQYFMYLAPLGIPTYGIRIIAQAGKNKEESSKAFSELFYINGISTTICLAIYYLLAFFTDGFGKGFYLYGIAGISILLNYFNVDWFFQGKEEYGYILKRNLFVKVLSIICVFLFVRSREDCAVYLTILVVGTGLNNLFNIFQLRKYVYLVYKNLNLWKHVKVVLALLSATIAAEVYALADTTMLTYMCGEDIVGLYSNSLRSISAIRTMMISICAVFLPRLSVYLSEGKKEEFTKLANTGLKILIMLSLPASAGLILIAKLIVPLLFGKGFLGAVFTTQILAVSIITVSLSNYIGYQVMVSLEKEKIILLSTVIGAVANVLLNSVLIIRFQQNGAAIASATTEGIVVAIQIVALRKYMKVQIEKQFLVAVLLSTAAMFATTFGILHVIENIPVVLQIVFSIGFGMLVYIGVNICLRNEMILTLKDTLLRKSTKA